LDAALDAGHLDSGLKARTGRRRPGYLQHRALVFPGGDATLPTRAIGPPSLCQIPDIIGTGPAVRKLVPPASRRVFASHAAAHESMLAVLVILFRNFRIGREGLPGWGGACPRILPAALTSCDPGHVTFRGFCIIF
jgi:hypothetical protein